MPDQPADPIHYDMKIPPEPKDAPLNAEDEGEPQQKGSGAASKSSDGERRGSDEVTRESNRMERDGSSGGERDGR